MNRVFAKMKMCTDDDENKTLQDLSFLPIVFSFKFLELLPDDDTLRDCD